MGPGPQDMCPGGPMPCLHPRQAQGRRGQPCWAEPALLARTPPPFRQAGRGSPPPALSTEPDGSEDGAPHACLGMAAQAA